MEKNDNKEEKEIALIVTGEALTKIISDSNS